MSTRKKNGQFRKGTHWRKPQKFRYRRWLERQYCKLGISAGDIGRRFGVTAAAVMYWMRKHKIKRRTVRQSRKLKSWGLSGPANPMWNRRGKLNPRWLGGVTPERQSFYASQEWKTACSEVWKRDKATCQRCRLKKTNRETTPFHVHHIVSFAVKALRAVVENLALLCEPCHDFVHSKRNVKREHLPKR